MNVTYSSPNQSILNNKFKIHLSDHDLVIALAGNPNVGKSTIFNGLTGLHQHTGNWPGKTVTHARGSYIHKSNKFVLIDLPGTYSILASSLEEQIARDFICFGNPSVTIVVADGTCLERNLNLTLQVMELSNNVILCVNLMDEAIKKGIYIDINGLQKELGIPVIGTCARNGEGLNELKDQVYNIALGIKTTSPKNIIYNESIEKEVKRLQPQLENLFGNKLNTRWLTLKILEGDSTILSSIQQFLYEEKSFHHHKEVSFVYE